MKYSVFLASLLLAIAGGSLSCSSPQPADEEWSLDEVLQQLPGGNGWEGYQRPLARKLSLEVETTPRLKQEVIRRLRSLRQDEGRRTDRLLGLAGNLRDEKVAEAIFKLLDTADEDVKVKAMSLCVARRLVPPPEALTRIIRTEGDILASLALGIAIRHYASEPEVFVAAAEHDSMTIRRSAYSQNYALVRQALLPLALTELREADSPEALQRAWPAFLLLADYNHLWPPRSGPDSLTFEQRDLWLECHASMEQARQKWDSILQTPVPDGGSRPEE